MLVLCGSPISNYYNKVKLALLEKGIPFTEEIVATGSRDEAVLSRRRWPRSRSSAPSTARCARARPSSPTSRAPVRRRRCCPDPFAAAKVRELALFVDLHLELVARELYRGLLRRHDERRSGPRPHGCPRAHRRLQAAGPLRALRRRREVHAGRLLRLDSLPLVSMATKAIFGEDLMAAAGIDRKPYTRWSASGRARRRWSRIARPCRRARLAKAEIAGAALREGLPPQAGCGPGGQRRGRRRHSHPAVSSLR